MASGLFELAEKIRGILAAKAQPVVEETSPSLSPEEYIQLHRQKQNDIIKRETLERMMRDIEKSGFFKKEKLPYLAKIITRVGGYNNDPFSYEDCLFYEEKEALKIDTDHKVSREMVECMTEKGLRQKDPHNIVPVIYYMNYFAVGRKYKLLELKGRGVKAVEIVNAGGELDCRAIEKYKGVFPIDKVPVLPAPRCDAVYCRCDYAAHDL
ncbi:MAG: hypothetical protein LBE14_08090 [Treponema sp.]|nr:hypothetical protein [Treponema sp.]